jgi:hypothetical protein
MKYTAEQLREEANKWDFVGQAGIASVYRAHAAALEQDAKLRKHAEAMGERFEDVCDGCWEFTKYDPFDEGWIANSRVYGQETNPYEPGSAEWEEWLDGWIAWRDYRPK